MRPTARRVPGISDLFQKFYEDYNDSEEKSREVMEEMECTTLQINHTAATQPSLLNWGGEGGEDEEEEVKHVISTRTYVSDLIPSTSTPRRCQLQV